MSLRSYESAVTRYTCQMRSAPAIDRTRHVESAFCNLRTVPLGHVADLEKELGNNSTFVSRYFFH